MRRWRMWNLSGRQPCLGRGAQRDGEDGDAAVGTGPPGDGVRGVGGKVRARVPVCLTVCRGESKNRRRQRKRGKGEGGGQVDCACACGAERCSCKEGYCAAAFV
eukprot:4922571-Pleurochrysis_carterae.AAC.1